MAKQTQTQNLQRAVTVPSLGNIPVLTYNGVPVVTSGLLAEAYGVDTSRIHQAFNKNKERFQEGKHYFKLAGERLKKFKLALESRGGVYLSKRYVVEIPQKTRHLILWTEIGAARHAKILETDQAWEVFEALESNYFKRKEEEALPRKATQLTLPAEPPANGRQIRWVGCAVNALLNFRYQNGVVMKPGEVRAEIAKELGFDRLEELPESRLQAANDLVLRKICAETGLEFPRTQSKESRQRQEECSRLSLEVLEAGHQALDIIRKKADQALKSRTKGECRVADEVDVYFQEHRRQIQTATELLMYTVSLVGRSVDMAGKGEELVRRG